MNRPTWTCDTCGQPADSHGYTTVNAADALHATQPILWAVHCDHCRLEPVEGDYAITLELLQTWARVDEWRGHLTRKRWFANTIWADNGARVEEGAA